MSVLLFTWTIISISSNEMKQLTNKNILTGSTNQKKLSEESYICPEYTKTTELIDGVTPESSKNVYSCKSTFSQQNSIKNSKVLLFNCTFKGITDTSNYGGALIISFGSATIPYNKGTIDGCYFIECKTGDRGGAIYIDGHNEMATEFSITNSHFIDNTVNKIGGAIYMESVSITLINNTFINNKGVNGADIYYEIPDTSKLSSSYFKAENNQFDHTFSGSESLIYIKSTDIIKISLNFDNNDVNLRNPSDGSLLFDFSNANTKTDYFVFSNNYINPLNESLIGPSGMDLKIDFENNFKPLEPENKNCSITSYTSGPINLCRSSNSDGKDVYIQVISSTFNDFKNESDGGVFHNLNCFFTCIRCKFNNCVSVNGGGGAIYIKNSLQNEYNVLIENDAFDGCKAPYGGAVYVYSNSELGEVLIKKCTFTSNVILERSVTKDGDLTGGSSLFLYIKKGKVFFCKFSGNQDTESVKIYNTFDQDSTARVLNVKLNLISICNCNFEKSKNSIFYVAGKKGSNVEIEKCNFNGKMFDDSYYIKGNMLFENSPKLRIKSCTFKDPKSIASNADLVEFDVKDDSVLKIMEYSFIAAGFVIALVILYIIVYIKSHKKMNDYSNSKDKLNESL